ncbi:hypothetical protein F5Y19DRAFT_347264 [Xylariaceae sp. FL1651]|nr:hypothetical protein F5Y19DRAFT_347264 [Xylariaceae sp. FL1651]
MVARPSRPIFGSTISMTIIFSQATGRLLLRSSKHQRSYESMHKAASCRLKGHRKRSEAFSRQRSPPLSAFPMDAISHLANVPEARRGCRSADLHILSVLPGICWNGTIQEAQEDLRCRRDVGGGSLMLTRRGLGYTSSTNGDCRICLNSILR